MSKPFGGILANDTKLLQSILRKHNFNCNGINCTSIMPDLLQDGTQYAVLLIMTGLDGTTRISQYELLQNAHPEAKIVFIGPDEHKAMAEKTKAFGFVNVRKIAAELPALLEKVKENLKP